MSQKSDYTEVEWGKLIGLSVTVPVYLLKKGLSALSIVRKVKEVQAYTAFRAKIVEKYPNNFLVTNIFATFNTESKETGNILSECLKSREALSSLINEVNEILSQKSDDGEAGEFKAAIYQYATEIASASGDGLLGGGAKINAQEAAFLHDLKRDLLGA